MKAFKKTGGRKMIHLCMEKNVALCKIYLNWFQIFDQILDQNLDQRVAHTTQQINSTSHKKRILYQSPFFKVLILFSVDFCDFQPFFSVILIS
jgi:hypothetical protein